MDLRQRFAILNDKKKIIKSICPEVTEMAGIYCFYRINEDGEKCCYIGQANNLLNRTAQHLMISKQHIDKSIYKHKLYSETNPYGWRLKILNKCCVTDLDFCEQVYINNYLNDNWKVYNVTGGGQYDKKADIGERQQTKLKSYKNGKNLGYEKAREEVKIYFDKYLDYNIKGKSNKIKERKLLEFKDWLEVQNGEVKES